MHSLLKTIAIVFLINIFFVSCKNETETIGDNISQFSSFPKISEISFSNLFEYQVGTYPKDIILQDSSLIFLNGGASIEHVLYKYSLKTKQMSGGRLQRGKGPGEVIGQFKFGLINSRLWIYDLTKKKILLAQLDSIFGSNESPKFSEFQSERFMDVDFLSDSVYLTSASETESPKKIQYVNLYSNKVENEVGDFSNLTKELQSKIRAVKKGYSSMIYLNPSRNKAVLSYFYRDAVEFFDLESGRQQIVIGPYSSPFKLRFYEEKGQYYHNANEDNYAFIKGACTEKYVYLLYSGRSTWDLDETKLNDIFVYDWNGNPIARLKPNVTIKAFTVAQDDKTIYAFDGVNGFIVSSEINLP